MAHAAKGAPPGSVHKIFVISKGPPEMTADTFKVLRFVAKVKPALQRMRIKISVTKLEVDMLAIPRVQQALRSKGVTAYPALLTPNRVYLGEEKIIAIYKRAYEDIMKLQRSRGLAGQGTAAQAKAFGGGTADDLYRDYIAGDMTLKAAMSDSGDTAIGENRDDIMGKYHAMMKQREQAHKKSKGRAPAYKAPGGMPAPPGERRGAAAAAPDNLADDDIDSLISQVTAGPVTQDTLDKAFKDEGGASDDDVLVRAFWENQAESVY